MLIRMSPNATGDERLLHVETGTVILVNRSAPWVRYTGWPTFVGEDAVAIIDGLDEVLKRQDAELGPAHSDASGRGGTMDLLNGEERVRADVA